MKSLCTALAALCFVGAVLAGGALAETNSATFNEMPGGDGKYHIDIGVSYEFPGTPPRTSNFGAGTVRITLPQSSLTLDPAQPADAGYNCFVESGGSSVICSNDGQSNGAGLTFPSSVTVHMVSATCYSPADPTGARADVWAAPNDPGTAPDASLPITPTVDCGTAPDGQPVLGGHGPQCVVPKLAGSTLASAKRQVRNAHCALGKVTFAHSKKVKKGRVISQSLKPKKVLKENTKVSFVVSKGP